MTFGGGRREYLDLLDKATPPAAAPIAAAVPTGNSDDPLMRDLDKGIKKTGEHSYEVQRATVDVHRIIDRCGIPLHSVGGHCAGHAAEQDQQWDARLAKADRLG